MREDSQGRPLHDQICDAAEFGKALQSHFDWIGCVPDSIYKSVLPALSSWQLVPRENHAIALAFGVKLGGKAPVVLMQNSGLGLAIDAILGTFVLYGQGLVVVVSNRGELPWEEIQHQDWGDITHDVLKACRLKTINFEDEGLDGLKRAVELANGGEVVALSVRRGNLNE